MTTDPWLHILQRIEPEYNKYKDIMEYGRPKFMIAFALLDNKKCQMHIQDDWSLTSREFDEGINWSKEQLASWPDCQQVTWNKWQFKHRKDAEKFKTLFTLKWAQ